MICAGIDGGSRAIKIALIEAEGLRLIGSAACDQGVHHDALTCALFDRLLAAHQLQRADIRRIVATGYTRNRLSLADTAVTEITCHATGVRQQVPEAMTIVEIGGQDSKLICLEAGGTVRDFSMNDRCAAGTGRFLEMVATRLDARLEDLGDLASRSADPAIISSTCVVFAETEIIGLLASGVDRQDIVAGVQAAIAQRVITMAGRSIVSPVVFTGGVARIGGMRQALQTALQVPVMTAPDPQITGALGAAVLAARQVHTAGATKAPQSR